MHSNASCWICWAVKTTTRKMAVSWKWVIGCVNEIKNERNWFEFASIETATTAESSFAEEFNRIDKNSSESRSREVSPKLVVGGKKYGRRSRPHSAIAFDSQSDSEEESKSRSSKSSQRVSSNVKIRSVQFLFISSSFGRFNGQRHRAMFTDRTTIHESEQTITANRQRNWNVALRCHHKSNVLPSLLSQIAINWIHKSKAASH